MLDAREARAMTQFEMLRDASPGDCLVCLTMNIAGEVKRTPMVRLLFDRGVSMLEQAGFCIRDSRVKDSGTGCEAFWLLKEDAARVKARLQEAEDAFPAARLFDFDVLLPDGTKLSRTVSRRCLLCDAPAAECARSRRHGLNAVKEKTQALLQGFCAETLAEAACDSLLRELYTTPKPGLVDRRNCGAHRDMDVPMFERSVESLRPYFRDAAGMGMRGCGMPALRARGVEAEAAMFAATGGVNTHKGMIYSMGLLLAGMGRALAEGDRAEEFLPYASGLARFDAEERLAQAGDHPVTNGGGVYRRYGARGAQGEAAAGFPHAVYCAERLRQYREAGFAEAEVLTLCDSIAKLEDTNLLHRGGPEGLAYAQEAAAEIAELPPAERTEALFRLDDEFIRRNLSPGGSADMLSLACLLERWRELSAGLFL